MSRVACHVSRVTCYVFFVCVFYKVVKLIGGGSVINGATSSSFKRNAQNDLYFSILLLKCFHKSSMSVANMNYLN